MNPPTGDELALLNEALDRVRAEAGHLVRAIDAVRTRMVFGPDAVDAFAYGLGVPPDPPTPPSTLAALGAAAVEIAASLAYGLGSCPDPTPKPSIAWPSGMVAIRKVLIDRAMSGDRITEADVLFAVTGARGLSAAIDDLEAAAEACGHASVQLGTGPGAVAVAEGARTAARKRIDQVLVEADVFWPSVPSSVARALANLSDAAKARGAVDAGDPYPAGSIPTSPEGREPFFALPRAQIAARGDVLNAILAAVAGNKHRGNP